MHVYRLDVRHLVRTFSGSPNICSGRARHMGRAAYGVLASNISRTLLMTAQLTFDDEFNSLSLWNGSSGTWDTTYWYDDNNKGSTLAGNGEQEMYLNANNAVTSVKPWSVSNGVLTLQAAPASASDSAAL